MIIKKNQKFTITNVIPDWESMGITQRENNENKGVDYPMVINGKLYCYDERYCKENEVVRMSWTSMTDKEDWEISEDFLGYCEGHLYNSYGFCTDDGIEVEYVDDEEFQSHINNPIYVGNEVLVPHIMKEMGRI
tara:strand:+ start:128 stop:529 length:402 start_codon:yes stop_codon:yes gene_type:complete